MWPDGKGPNMILDDGGDATLLVHKGKEFEAAGVVPDRRRDDSEEYAVILDTLRRSLTEDPQRWTDHRRRHQGRHRGDHDRRAPPLRDDARGRAALPGDQRQRLGHQEQVRQQVRLPPLAHRRHQPRHRRPHRRQGRRRLRLRRRGQGLGRVAARPGRSRHRHRDRPDLRAAGGDGRLPGRPPRGRHRHRRHLHHGHRLLRRHQRRAHGEDEAPGDRRQHRPLRQRDRHGRPRRTSRASSARRSSRRSTSGPSPTATRSSCCPRAAC